MQWFQPTLTDYVEHDHDERLPLTRKIFTSFEASAEKSPRYSETLTGSFAPKSDWGGSDRPSQPLNMLLNSGRTPFTPASMKKASSDSSTEG